MKNWAALALVAAALAGCSVFHGHGKDKERTPVLGERLPVLTYEASAEPDPALADIQVALPPAVPNDSWTQPGGSPDKSMGNLALAANPSLAWTASIGQGSS